MPLPNIYRRKGSILLCLLFFFNANYAQDYIIRHDLQKDNTSFFKVGKDKDTIQVRKIGFKKPGRIILRVENFNPFYWNAKVTTFERPVEEQSSYIQIFSGLSKSLGLNMNFNMPVITRGSPPGATGNNKEAVIKGLEFNQQAYNRLQAVYAKANEMKALESELMDLKFDKYKSEAEIKSEAAADIAKVIGESRMKFEDVLPMGSELDKRQKELSDSLGLAPLQFSFLNELSRIEKLYNEITYTSYKFSYSVGGNPDINELKLDIFPRADSLGKDTVTKYFRIQSKPVLRIRNSVGIAFTYFEDKNTSYFVRPDSTIGKGSGDLFTPVLSVFMHFYNNRSSGLKWGGTFGFGVPLLGEKKDINFMLGLCTLLGRNEPVIISAGVTGAKVDRLGKGWKVGQKVPNLNFQIPASSQFRLGGFVSVTFNLNSIASGK